MGALFEPRKEIESEELILDLRPKERPQSDRGGQPIRSPECPTHCTMGHDRRSLRGCAAYICKSIQSRRGVALHPRPQAGPGRFDTSEHF